MAAEHRSLHHAQLLWSLFVALVVATVALQQAMSAHREPASISIEAPVVPQELITGQTLPLQSTLPQSRLPFDAGNTN
jgi:hypothetical protein